MSNERSVERRGSEEDESERTGLVFHGAEAFHESVSDASSVGSAPAEEGLVDLRTMVDFTHPTLLCRVRMIRKTDGGNVPCVCGNVAEDCKRRNHKVKQADYRQRGPLGFYVGHVSPGSGVADGRLDRAVLSDSEVRRLRSTEHQEMEQLVGGIDGGEDDQTVELVAVNPSSPIATVSFKTQGPTPVRDNTQTRADKGIKQMKSAPGTVGVTSTEVWYGLMIADGKQPFITADTAEMTTLIRDKAQFVKTFLSEKSALQWCKENLPLPVPSGNINNGVYRGTSAANTASSGEWYGLEMSDGARACGHGITNLRLLQDEGYHLRNVYDTQKEAMVWVDGDRDILPTTAPAGIKTSTGPLQGTSASAIPVTVTGRSPGLAQGSGSFSLLGSDTSAGDPKMIYGIPHADRATLDEVLCPPTMTDQKARDRFFETGMDVAALPGGYRGTAAFEEAEQRAETAEAMLATTRGGTGYHMSYKGTRQNGLKQIRTKADLFEFVGRVEKAVIRGKTTEESRMSSYLYDCGISYAERVEYLRIGFYPRILAATYGYYHGLINFLRSKAYDMDGVVWKESYAFTILAHHMEELAEIRRSSADCRDHVLSTYIYLRDADKKGFTTDTSSVQLWKLLETHRPGGGVSAATGRSAEGRTGVCSHCQGQGLHTGTSRYQCLMKNFTAGPARAALTGLTKSIAVVVARKLNERKVATPDVTDWGLIIQEIRSEAGAP